METNNNEELDYGNAVIPEKNKYKHITKELLDEELKRIISNNMDFVYERPDPTGQCKYTDGGNCTGCIFGQALTNLGVLREDLEFWDKNSMPSTSGIIYVLGQLTEINSLEPYASMQSKQDIGYKWGDLLKRLEHKSN